MTIQNVTVELYGRHAHSVWFIPKPKHTSNVVGVNDIIYVLLDHPIFFISISFYYEFVTIHLSFALEI